MIFSLYVPFSGNALAKIKKGSAVLTDGETFGLIDGVHFTVDFEGNIYGDNMSYIDKLHRAAYRHVTKYPTVARMVTNIGEVKYIGHVMFEDWKLTSLNIMPSCQNLLLDWVS